MKLRELDEQKYPDSQKGAIAALSNMSTWDVSQATAVPDPQVQGVWLVTNIFQNDGIKGQAIVHLAGYKDSYGNVRDMNDFESEEL